MTLRCVHAPNDHFENITSKRITMKREDKEAEQRFSPTALLEYLIEPDWTTTQNRIIGVHTKLGCVSQRLRKYGIEQLRQLDRAGPVAAVCVLHYGIHAVGTTACTCRHLHNLANDFAVLIKKQAVAMAR